MTTALKNVPKTFKIVILGDTNVGKTSLFVRYLRDEFREAIANTIAISNDFKEILVDGNPVHLQMWDTAGQEKFKSIVSQLYRDADGFIFVYDVNTERSFSGMKNLIGELGEILSPKFTAVVGNKIDCVEPGRLDEKKSVLQDFAAKNKFRWFLTSAKTGESVNDVFEYLSKSLYYNKGEKTKPRGFISVIKRKRKFCL